MVKYYIINKTEPDIYMKLGDWFYSFNHKSRKFDLLRQAGKIHTLYERIETGIARQMEEEEFLETMICTLDV